MWPRFRALPNFALALAVASLALGSVVEASIHRRRNHVDAPRARFDVVGRLRGPLWPGVAQPVDIALSNRLGHVLWVSDLRVRLTVDRAHAAAGCSATRDFVVRQLPRSVYPIMLPARLPYLPGWPARLRWPGSRSRVLRDLGVTRLPSVAMVDLAQIDQDGCKGAALRLAFTATSRMYPPHAQVLAP